MTQHFATHSARLTVQAEQVRTETMLGREHVVAPVTLVREMVLKGELLPFEEIQRTAMAWNGAPVTVQHPRTENGEFLPASMDASRFERYATGQVFGVDTDADRRSLDGEVWVDRQRAAETAEALEIDDPAGMLLDGESVEVSTGYWYRKDEQTGTYEGADYRAQQRDVQPDHLATLPNGEGECSLTDGCGAGAGTDAAAASVAQGAAVATDGGSPEPTDDPETLFARLASALGVETTAAGDEPTLACNCTDDCDCGGAANQQVGDAVRWQSDAAGSVTVDGTSYRYGVVVDGLQDEADDALLVAVYEPSDGEWTNRNEQNQMDAERLEVVGSDGKGSLPAISQLGGQSADAGTWRVLATQNGDTTTMTTYDIDDLVEATGLSAETLDGMDDDELASLAEATLADGDGDGDDDDNDDTPDGDGDGDGDTDTANAADTDVDTLASAVADQIGDDLDRRVEEAVAAQTGRGREELVATIQTHADNADVYDLDGMSLSALEGLAEDVAPSGGVYAGRAGAAQSDDVPESTGVTLDDIGGDD